MKILITGGAGYVGGAVTDYLMSGARWFHEIVVFDNLTFDEQYSKPCRFVRGDVRNIDELKPWLEWADVVIWLAALVGDGACRAREADAIDINLGAVKTLADNFNGRILFTSTCSVYGAQDGVIDESSPTNPLSTYARTKLEAESVLLGANKNAVILRFGTLFGISDSYARIRFDLVVNAMTRSAVETGRIDVFGGSQWRPLLHVDDAGRILVRMAMECSPGIYNLHAFNSQIMDIAEAVRWNVGEHVQINTTEMSTIDTRNYRVLSQPAHMMGYNPTHGLEDGIREIKHALDSKRIRNPFSDRYTNESYLVNERDRQ